MGGRGGCCEHVTGLLHQKLQDWFGSVDSLQADSRLSACIWNWFHRISCVESVQLEIPGLIVASEGMCAAYQAPCM